MSDRALVIMSHIRSRRYRPLKLATNHPSLAKPAMNRSIHFSLTTLSLTLSCWAIGPGAIAQSTITQSEIAQASQREIGDRVTVSEENGWIKTHVDHTKRHPDPLYRQLEAGDELAFKGEMQAAITQYQILFDQARQPNQQIWKVVALTRMAQAQIRLSQYQTALNTLDAAEKAYNAVDANIEQRGLDTIDLILAQHSHRRDIFETRGSVYKELGQLEAAIENYQATFNISRRDPLSYRRDIFALNQIGNLYAQLGQREQARTYYHQALVFIDTVGSPFTPDRKPTAGIPIPQLQRTLYGSEWRQQRQHPMLEKIERDPSYFRRFISSRLLHDWARPALVLTMNNLGRFYSENYSTRTGLELHQVAVQEGNKLGNRHLMGLSILYLGELQRKANLLPEAIDNYQKAIKLSQGLGDRNLESQALQGLGQAYMQKGQLPQATQSMTSAVQVLESLRPGLSDRHMISLFEQQEQIYRRLQQALIAQNQIGPALEIAERGRARAFVELLARRQSGTTTTATTLPNQTQLQQIAKQQNTTLVSYSIIPAPSPKGSAQLYSWVVKPTGEIGFRQIDLKAELKGKNLGDVIDTMRMQGLGVRGRGSSIDRSWKPAIAKPITETVSEKKGRQQDPTLQQLHRILIQPIGDLLPSDPNAKITFVPQDKLFLVPFAALQNDQGEFLIEKHTVAIAPSIQALELLRSQPTTPSGQALVVGNPTMPKVIVETQQPPEELAPLPGAEIEAKQIAQLLNTQPLIGDAATKSQVVQQMGQASIIHLATHGLMDDFKGLGMPGAIALAPSGKENGLLTSDEIMRLKLKADMVVLSACDTGRGNITGDGVIGLSRSLLSAGAKSVVVSLWAVPDGATVDLMTAFYQQIPQGQDRAIAMRQAMLQSIQKYPNPRDWAAFTVIGN